MSYFQELKNRLSEQPQDGYFSELKNSLTKQASPYFQKIKDTISGISVPESQPVEVPGLRKFADTVIEESPKIADRTLEALNPGSTFIESRLKESGVSAGLAAGIGLGIDILAPGPGELARAKKGKELIETASSKVAKEISPLAQPYKETGNLTTKILKDLEGKTTVSKQYILDATNRGDLKQVERDLIRQTLETEGNTINVADFAKKVKGELLPLKVIDEPTKGDVGRFASPDREYRYEYVNLPEELRGNVKNYRERVYQSPIKTSAGDVHFNSYGKDKKVDSYFGHTRIEDMADNQTRRVIEVQSDLYQKGRLEKELEAPQSNFVGWLREKGQNKLADRYENRDFIKTPKIPEGGFINRQHAEDFYAKQDSKEKILADSEKFVEKYKKERGVETAKLQQYNDPTAHFRMVREEIKKAAQDGKTKLQFPTGETAMKIEGLGTDDARWFFTDGSEDVIKPFNLKQGFPIQDATGEQWIITDVLGDGKFKAVPKETIMSMEDELAPLGYTSPDDINFADKKVQEALSHQMAGVEQFDISGKVDTSNPIYKFYEKDLGKYLSNKYGAKRVIDDKGVAWYEVAIDKSMSKSPVEAFAIAPILLNPKEENE